MTICHICYEGIEDFVHLRGLVYHCSVNCFNLCLQQKAENNLFGNFLSEHQAIYSSDNENTGQEHGQNNQNTPKKM